MLMEGFSMVLSDPLSVVLVAVGTLIGTIFGAIPRSDGYHGRYDLPAHDLCNE